MGGMYMAFKLKLISNLHNKINDFVLDALGMSEKELYQHMQQTGKRLSTLLEEKRKEKRERSF